MNTSKSKSLNGPAQNRDVIYQVSLLQGLTNGDYHGSVAVRELKKHGDTGIGTFNRLNGELIMLDGAVYRAAGNGSVELVSADETKGGHVLGVNIADAVLTWDDTDGFELRLPQNKMFSGFDLTVDQSEDIKKVETNQ